MVTTGKNRNFPKLFSTTVEAFKLLMLQLPTPQNALWAIFVTRDVYS